MLSILDNLANIAERVNCNWIHSVAQYTQFKNVF